jgi:hypothetical protein
MARGYRIFDERHHATGERLPNAGNQPLNLLPVLFILPTSNLQAGEAFKIRGGKIHEVEAMGVSLPHGTKSGWESNRGVFQPASEPG